MPGSARPIHRRDGALYSLRTLPELLAKLSRAAWRANLRADRRIERRRQRPDVRAAVVSERAAGVSSRERDARAHALRDGAWPAGHTVSALDRLAPAGQARSL